MFWARVSMHMNFERQNKRFEFLIIIRSWTLALIGSSALLN